MKKAMLLLLALQVTSVFAYEKVETLCMESNQVSPFIKITLYLETSEAESTYAIKEEISLDESISTERLEGEDPDFSVMKAQSMGDDQKVLYIVTLMKPMGDSIKIKQYVCSEL